MRSKFEFKEEKAELVESKETKGISDELKQAIVSFNPKSLKKLPVYFANTNTALGKKFLPYHGFLVTGTPGYQASYTLYIENKENKLEEDKVPVGSYIAKNHAIYFKNSDAKLVDLEVEEKNAQKFLSKLKKGKTRVKLTGVDLQEFRSLTNTGKHIRPKSQSHLQGKPYKIATDVMRAPFRVPPQLLRDKTLKKLSKNTKLALKALKGKTFATVEYFVKALLIERAKIEKKHLTHDDLDNAMHNLEQGIKDIIALNGKYNRYTGSHVPSSFYTKVAERDLELFQSGNTVYRELEEIHAIDLHEKLLELKLYSQYLDEKIGVGKSLSEQEKIKIIDQLERKTILAVQSQYVYHETFPTGKYEANCNSSSASLAESGLNKRERKHSMTPQNIPTATHFAHASNNRMHLHDPVRANQLTGIASNRASFYAHPERKVENKSLPITTLILHFFIHLGHSLAGLLVFSALFIPYNQNANQSSNDSRFNRSQV